MRIYNIAKAPLYYVRSGDIRLNNDLRSPGTDGACWPARAYAINTHAHAFTFSVAGVYVSSSGEHYYGFSLRWTAKDKSSPLFPVYFNKKWAFRPI